MSQAPQARTFAEAALQEPSVEVHGVHGRYAMALFHAAVKKGDLDKIDKDLAEVGVMTFRLQALPCSAMSTHRIPVLTGACFALVQIQALAKSNKVFAQFLADPSVPKKEKMGALNEILSKIQVSETTQALFGALSSLQLALTCRPD